MPDKLGRAVTYLARVAAAWPVSDPAPTLKHHCLAGKSLRERRAGYPLACVYPPGADQYERGRTLPVRQARRDKC